MVERIQAWTFPALLAAWLGLIPYARAYAEPPVTHLSWPAVLECHDLVDALCYQILFERRHALSRPGRPGIGTFGPLGPPPGIGPTIKGLDRSLGSLNNSIRKMNTDIYRIRDTRRTIRNLRR